MEIKDEIIDYISRKELTGALLLTGGWGCGKSYLIKEIAKEQNAEKQSAVAIVSLFGLDSVEAINQRVKEEYLNFVLGPLGNKGNKLAKSVIKFVKDGLKVADTAAKGVPGINAASQGLSEALNYDVFGYVSVKNKVGTKKKQREFVLVFDDLERNELPKKILLGAINEYIENKQIKVIIVADKDKINSPEYDEYSEKLISRTIRMNADYESLINSIIKRYSETAKGYRHFLFTNRKLIYQVFSESNSDNLRTLKTVLADFERVYDVWTKAKISTENMKWALYTFACDIFSTRNKEVNNTQQEKSDVTFFFNNDEQQYKLRGKNNSSFSAFYDWIHEGIWEEKIFLVELTSKYGKREYDPVIRFLSGFFWGLQQTDIDEGMPRAIELGYSGELSREQLIWLITKIHYLRQYEIDLPCEVSYDRLQDGLEKRKGRIKSGEIEEPKCHTFAKKEQLDLEALSLYEEIEKVETFLMIWKRREEYRKSLHGEQSIDRGLALSCFDDDLLVDFEAQYSKADNWDKYHYINCLLNLSFDNPSFSSEADIQITKSNLHKLSDWLCRYESSDAMTNLLNKKAIQSILEHKILKTTG